MDLPNPKKPALSSRKRKAKESNDSSIIPSKRTKFFSTFHQQTFAFPNSIMYYITIKSAKIYRKMIKICKQFFAQKPFLFISRVCYDRENGWHIWLNGKRINLEHQICSRFWFTNELNLCRYSFNEDNVLSSLMPKVFRSDIQELQIQSQNISYKDLIFLASNCINVRFDTVTVMDGDGSVVPMEKIIEALPKLEHFKFVLHDISAAKTITSETVQELIKIPHFSNLDEFHLDEIPDTFEIETFFEYIKKNKKTNFWFEFSDKIFVDYQLRLDRIVQEIVFSENHGYKPPWILYKGVSHRKELHELFFLQR